MASQDTWLDFEVGIFPLILMSPHAYSARTSAIASDITPSTGSSRLPQASTKSVVYIYPSQGKSKILSTESHRCWTIGGRLTRWRSGPRRKLFYIKSVIQERESHLFIFPRFLVLLFRGLCTSLSTNGTLAVIHPQGRLAAQPFPRP